MLNELRDDLRNQIAQGHVVAVVGAGVSLAATENDPLSSWTGLLLSGIARCRAVARGLPKQWPERLKRDLASGDMSDRLSVAQRVTDKLGGIDGAEYARWLHDSVGSLQAKNRRLIECLAGLGVVLATTNYDGLIEQVTGLPAVTWRDHTDVERALRKDPPGVIHLHGYWAKPESVVLGVASYERVLADTHTQVVLRCLAITKTLVFIGYGAGLDDPNFRSLLRWIENVCHDSPYRRFRLARTEDVCSIQNEHSADQRLFVIPYGKHDDLPGFLQDLVPRRSAAMASAGGPEASADDDSDRRDELRCELQRLRAQIDSQGKDLRDMRELLEQSLGKDGPPKALPSRDELGRLERELGIEDSRLQRAAMPIRELIEESRNIDSLDFTAMSLLLRRVDCYALRQVRQRFGMHGDELARTYQQSLAAVLEEEGLNLPQLYRGLHRQDYVGHLLSSVPVPALTVDIGEHFDHIAYSGGPNLILEVRHPRLLWDCICNGRAGNAEHCPIHRHGALADKINARFQYGLVELRWRGMKLYWRNGSELWPPAIDAFLMADALSEAGAFSGVTSSVLDLGAGTGFLGIVAARQSSSVASLCLADWLLTPLLYGQLNWRLNSDGLRHVAVRSLLGMHTNWLFADDLTNRRFDLVVCNPPYLPKLPGFERLSMESTVFGTDLLEHVISRSRTLGRRVYVQCSQIAWREARAAADRAGVMLASIGKQHRVPFRVRSAIDSPAYINALRKPDRGLVGKKGQDHAYWHTLRMVMVK